MKVSILLVIVSLLIVAETAVYRRGASESKVQYDSNALDSPEGNKGCNLVTHHDVLLGGDEYILTTCYDGMHSLTLDAHA